MLVDSQRKEYMVVIFIKTIERLLMKLSIRKSCEFIINKYRIYKNGIEVDNAEKLYEILMKNMESKYGKSFLDMPSTYKGFTENLKKLDEKWKDK